MYVNLVNQCVRVWVVPVIDRADGRWRLAHVCVEKRGIEACVETCVNRRRRESFRFDVCSFVYIVMVLLCRFALGVEW